MTNVNCLSGLACPHCGNADRLLVSATIRASVTDEGAEIAFGSDLHWDDSSPTECPECGHNGTLLEFRDRRLPPDPDGRNDSRAAWAGYALAAFVSQTGTDAGDAVTDLLCDLMHLADREGTDFAADLERARMHYAAETQPDFTTEAPTTSPTATKGLDA
jgi:hypothetical protein